MSQAKFQVTLAVDGKHTVSVQSDDPAAVTEGLLWAQDTYKKLIRLSRPGAATGQADREDIEPSGYQRIDPETDPPICGVHDVPMVLVQGKKGPFWSCHEKNADGSWCSFRPRG